MPKRDQLRDTDPLSSPVPTDSSIRDFDAALYGQRFDKVDNARQIAKPIIISDIQPDPTQPRRALPSAIRQNWNGDPTQLQDVFAAWLEAVENERGSAFDLNARLLAESDYEPPEHVGALEASLLTLVELAASIRRDGLTNPITVARDGMRFRLETGERRWLAFHLLYAVFQDDQWLRIPARVVERADVWRQASENNARANLNAIGRARQFALLLMDLLAQQGETFQPFDALAEPGGSDRAFYAQVADGNRYRIPRGKGEMMYNAMGLKNDSQLRRIRDLLNVPNEFWQVADDLNWTERRIRDLREQAKDDDHLLWLMVLDAKKEGYTVPMGTVSPPPKRDKSSDAPKLLATADDRKRFKTLATLDTDITRYEQKRKQELRQMIDEQRRWLDEVERLLSE